MNFTLTRGRADLYGIFGQIKAEDGSLTLCTLEHPFSDGAAFVPKLATGVYTCQRGIHRLHNLVPFETFEVMNVPDFQGKSVSGILCGHVGNYQKDSDGCVLLGTSFGTGCILDSMDAFEAFMAIQTGCDSYQLTVV